jgi:hypothetical protein
VGRRSPKITDHDSMMLISYQAAGVTADLSITCFSFVWQDTRFAFEPSQVVSRAGKIRTVIRVKPR